MLRFGSPARWFSETRQRRLTVVLALALVTLALPAWSFAQAPTFNAFIATPKGGEPWFKPANAAVGDYNGDGKLDALIADGSYNSEVRLLLGNGNGTFTPINVNVSASPTNPTPIHIEAADLNGDGRLDAVFASPQGNLAPTVMLNTGNVSGVPQFALTTYPGFWSGIRSLTLGDLNGDGRPDFIVGNAYGYLQVYLNNGNGSFTAGQFTNLEPNVGGSTGPGAIADLNGDGNADYLVTSNQASATDIFFGNGDGTLQAPVVYPSNGLYPAVADLNEDGTPDFATVDGNGNLMVYLNNGNGTFSGPTLISTGLTNPASLVIVDISGDGNLDAVLSDFGSGSGVNGVTVFLGDGAGAFGSANPYTVNQRPLDVSVRDFNGDGKLDIATVGYNDNTYGVLLNTTVIPVTCAAGSYLASPGDLTCTLAPAGSFVAASGATEATQCLVGTYSAVAGATSCTLAPAGSFVATAGAASAALCPAGTYSATAGAASCALAPTGYVVASAGSTSPTACAAGTYADTFGAVACTPAPAGSYVSITGAASATACPAGTYSAAAGSSSCTPAPAGSFVPSTGATAATACAAGSYSASAGSSTCIPAPAGYFVPSPGASSATACAPGYGSAAGATSCYALDNDGDGVNNDVDAYPNSNMNATVSVGTCGTSVANQVMPNGATFNDLIAAIGGANHGAKVSGVSQLSNGWKSAGLISGRDHGAIVSCTAKSK